MLFSLFVATLVSALAQGNLPHALFFLYLYIGYVALSLSQSMSLCCRGRYAIGARSSLFAGAP